MKKLIFALVILSLIPLSAYSQRRGSSAWSLNVSGGASSASMDAKMQLIDDGDESSDYGTFEDYEGKWGAEFQIAIKVGRVETAYMLQTYYAEKDGKAFVGGTQVDEEGEVSFVNELIDVSYYIIEDPVLNGLTASVGIGKGTSKIDIDRKINNQEHKEKFYAIAYTYHGSAYYHILDWLFLKATYRVVNINNVELETFGNSVYSLSVGATF